MILGITDVFHTIMTPLYYAVSALLLFWHRIFAQVLPGGWAWALSIIGLTVTIRALLIPLFVKQIKSSRNMQLIQPQLKELREKYGHDRERFAQEQMKLFSDSGTNPFSSCLPLLVQMPIFFALFHVIRGAATGKAIGFLSAADVAKSNPDALRNAVFLGGRLADTFMKTDHLETRIVAAAMVVIMTISQFVTQRQLMAKNMTADAMSGPYAQQQKMMLYTLPLVFAFSGVAFPVGVLLYWVTSNLWTMGQQFWVIRNNPAPGTPAFEAKQERDRARGRTVQEDPIKKAEAERKAADAERQSGRQQPKKQPRSQRKPGQQPRPQGGGASKPGAKPAAPKASAPKNGDPKNGGKPGGGKPGRPKKS